MSNLKTKDKLLAGFALVFVSLLVYLWFSPSGLKVIPDLELTTIKGEKIQLTSLRGQPLLITFWATSCPGCIKEMPHLIELHNKYSAQGLKVIGISMPYDRPDHVMKMAKQKALPYTIAMDINKQAIKAFGDVSLTPTTFLIAPNGTIVRQKIGEFDMYAVEKHIQQLLALSSNRTTASAQKLQPANDVKKIN